MANGRPIAFSHCARISSMTPLTPLEPNTRNGAFCAWTIWAEKKMMAKARCFLTSSLLFDCDDDVLDGRQLAVVCNSAQVIRSRRGEARGCCCLSIVHGNRAGIFKNDLRRAAVLKPIQREA